MKRNIVVVGTGYVGLSNAILLSQNNKVIAVDIIKDKVDMINNRISPIVDKEIEDYLKNKNLDLLATVNFEEHYKSADFIIIATPTNYDEINNKFDTSSVEKVIKDVLLVNKNVLIVIKSTIPIGFTEKMIEKYDTNNIIFNPEFLREGHALYDNLYPSRIVVGVNKNTTKVYEKALEFSKLLKCESLDNNTEVLLMGIKEAESVKLFANTYLAMRVAYFNELDTFAESLGLNSKEIVQGISLDKRIGNYYNNPSFGYGGYCLPKDTKQLLANFDNIPQTLITAVIESNKERKQFVTDQVIKKAILYNNGNNENLTIGIYRLTMKADSDNFRQSAIQDIMNNLKEKSVTVVIYEPTINDSDFSGYEVISDFEKFVSKSDIIIANRMEKILEPFQNKIYTRDIFNRD